MYRRLQPYLNKFVCIRQGMLGRAYAGRITHIDPECVEIQTYKLDGTKGERWTVSMATVTDFLTESEQLGTLALKVQWAISNAGETEGYPDEGMGPLPMAGGGDCSEFRSS